MQPTEEQWECARLFRGGDSMAIDALAGTGKTSTLRLLAKTTLRTGKYLAYNRSIVDDVGPTLPHRCSASTAHSLAYRATGHRYAHRLPGRNRAPRMRGWEVARLLGIDPIYVSAGLPKEKRLSPGWLAGHVQRALAVFCNSADPEPTVSHFPYADGIDMPDPDTGKRGIVNNVLIAHELEHALVRAWGDILDPDGTMRFTHDHYLKIWALTDPQITADYILLDEAQDTNPVLGAVLDLQTHAQRVYVGDENQQLYEWRGAIDSMQGFDFGQRRALTRTFRFGPAIADEANDILDILDAPLRIEPHDIDSTTGRWSGDVDAVLCRTNAKVIETLIGAQARGRPVHLLGSSGAEIASFARAAAELKAEGRTTYHELATFDSWNEVLEYVRDDEGGSDLKLAVRLVEQFGTEAIINSIAGAGDPGPGVLTVATGHQAKGRQWDVVRIADDFVDRDETPAELRLRYVAFTRARLHLDNSAFLNADPRGRDSRTGRAIHTGEFDPV